MSGRQGADPEGSKIMKHQPADYCKGSDKFSGTFGSSICPVCNRAYSSTGQMRIRRHLTPKARSGEFTERKSFLAADVSGANKGMPTKVEGQS